jgi:O-antigen ligase
MSNFEKTLLWITRIGTVAVLFTPLIIFNDLFFPFITGKNFFFRILVEIIFAAYLPLAVLNLKFRPSKTPILIALSAFIAVISLATVLGVDPYHSFWSNFERMEGLITHLHVFLFFIVVTNIYKDEKEWFFFFNISVSVATLMAVYGIFEHAGLTSTSAISEGGRLVARLGNSIYLAVYLMFHLFIISALALRVREKALKFIYLALFFLNFYVFFLASSRGAFIGFSIGIVWSALCALWFLNSRSVKIAAASIIVIVLLLGILISFFPTNPVVQRTNLFQRLASVQIHDLTSEPRIMIWGIALHAIKERPLLGWGPENFIITFAKFYNPDLYSSEPWFDRAHNMLLEWLVAAGLIGFLSYIGIFAALFYILVKSTRENILDSTTAIIISGFFVAYVAQNIFVFDNVVTYIIIFTVLAYVNSLYQEKFRAKKIYKKVSESTVSVLAAFSLVFLCVSVYFLNIRPILAAGQIITALQSVSRDSTKSVEEILAEFEKVASYNTFGTEEMRERLGDISVQLITNADQITQGHIQFLDKGISELESEAESHPFDAKNHVFLGKLYTLKMNVTHMGGDKAEAEYKKALELSPGYVQTYLGLAELYLISNRNEDASRVANQAYALMDNKVRKAALFYPALSVKVLARDYDGTIQFLKSEKEYFGLWPGVMDDNEGVNTRLLVQRLIASPKNLEARLAILKALDNELDRPYIYIGLAQTYGELGNKKEAREFALKALALDNSLQGEVDKFLESLGK